MKKLWLTISVSLTWYPTRELIRWKNSCRESNLIEYDFVLYIMEFQRSWKLLKTKFKILEIENLRRQDLVGYFQ